MKEIAELLDQHIGSGAGADVRHTFACMDIAEYEISAYKRQNPRRAAKAHQAFRWLLPGDLLRGKSEALYRAHVRELIHRVAHGGDPLPLTRAEVVVLLSNQSLVAPLAHQYAACMTSLFAELELGPVEPIAEPWAGATDDLLGELRRKFSKDGNINPRVSVQEG